MGSTGSKPALLLESPEVIAALANSPLDQFGFSNEPEAIAVAGAGATLGIQCLNGFGWGVTWDKKKAKAQKKGWWKRLWSLRRTDKTDPFGHDPLDLRNVVFDGLPFVTGAAFGSQALLEVEWPSAVRRAEPAISAVYSDGPLQFAKHRYTCASSAVLETLSDSVPAFQNSFLFLLPFFEAIRGVIPARVLSLLPWTANGAVEVLLCRLAGIIPYTRDAVSLAVADNLEQSPSVIDALEHAIRRLLAGKWNAARLSVTLSAFDGRSWPAQVTWETDRAVEKALQTVKATPASESSPPAETLPEYVVEAQPWWTPLPSTKEESAEKLMPLAPEIDVVLLTATEVERDSVLRLMAPLPPRQKVLHGFVGPETYFVGRFGTFNAALTKCRMGSVGPGSATLAADEARRVWRPRAIIMVGIAFGRDPVKQLIGDVLVASEVIFYEQQRVGEEVIARGIIPPSSPTLLNRFEHALGWDFRRPDQVQSACRVGPVLSGEKLVDHPEFKASLFSKFPQAVGGEMEGAGLCAAAIRSSVPWILVKAICDWGDGKKHKKHQPLAAASAASLVHHVLSQKGALHGLEKPGGVSASSR